jgi:hypothetical protein
MLAPGGASICGPDCMNNVRHKQLGTIDPEGRSGIAQHREAIIRLASRANHDRGVESAGSAEGENGMMQWLKLQTIC